MPVERSAGIILFRNTPEGRRYLVIRSSYRGKNGKHQWWDFTKELLEGKETGVDAAKRAVKEEAGIEDFETIPGFKKTVQYFIKRERDDKAVMKFVAMFLAESKTDEVKLSWEHDKFEWLPYEEAKSRISNPQMKRALDSAEEFLKSK